MLTAMWMRADDPTPADGEVVPLRSSIELEGPFSELRAFVAGATGGTGQAIVRRLVAEGVPVRALVRNVSQAVRCSLFQSSQFHDWQGLLLLVAQ